MATVTSPAGAVSAAAHHLDFTHKSIDCPTRSRLRALINASSPLHQLAAPASAEAVRRHSLCRWALVECTYAALCTAVAVASTSARVEHGYSPHSSLTSLSLSSTIDTDVHNKVCERCCKRHRTASTILTPDTSSSSRTRRHQRSRFSVYRLLCLPQLSPSSGPPSVSVSLVIPRMLMLSRPLTAT